MANPIYNVLQAKSAVATASSNMSGFLPKLAIDGSGSTLSNPSRWVSANSTAGEWLQVDIGRLAVINKFVLYTGNSADNVINNGNSIQNGDFQIRQNGQWLTVGSFRNNNVMNPKIEVKLDKGYLTDAIRLYFPIAEGQYRVFELEAYGRILGKAAKGLTSKNLLPSFTDSLWNYTRPIVSISPRKVVLDLDQSRTNEYIIPAKPNTTYTLSGKTDGRVYIVQRVGNNDKVGTGYSNWNTFSRTITTGSDVNGLRVSMTADGAGIFTYEDVMLNEGATALPYELYNLLPKAAKFLPKKNLVDNVDNLGSYAATYTVLDNWSIRADFTTTNSFVMKIIPVKPNTNYVFSTKHNAKIAVYGLTTNTSERIVTYVTDQSVVFNSGSRNEVRLVFGTSGLAAGIYDFDEIQLEEGTVATPFEKYKGINKVAAKLPKKNLIDYSTIVLRSGTNGYTIEGNKITFDANKQDYAGVNFVTPDIWASGKTITLSCIDRSAGATPMLAYYPAGSQSLAYIGLSGGQYSKVINVPAGATGLRFYIQNDAGTRGNFWVKGLQAELGSVVTPYEKFKLGAKAAVLQQPKKNMLKDFRSGAWLFSAQATVIDNETFTLNGNAPYLGSFQTFDVEANTTYVFSFEYSSVPTGRAVTPIIMGYAGANLLATLFNQSANPSPAVCVFTTPANCNKVKVGIQNSNNTDAVFTFKKAQVEKGSVPTPYNKYALQAKAAKY